MNTNLKNIPEEFAPNYLAAIMWKDDNGNTYRYALWNNVGEKFFFDIPLYAGQVIRKNFRFEIWTITGSIAVAQASIIQFLTSVLQGVDYRYGGDTKLVADDGTIVDFSVSILPSATVPTAGLVGQFKADSHWGNDPGPVQQWISEINVTDSLVWDGANAPIRATSSDFNGKSYIDFSTGSLGGTKSVIFPLLQTLFNANLINRNDGGISIVFVVCKSISSISNQVFLSIRDSGNAMIRQASLKTATNSFGMNGFGFANITQYGQSIATLRLGDNFGVLQSVPNAYEEAVVTGTLIPSAVVNFVTISQTPIQIAEILIYTGLANNTDYVSILQYLAQTYSNGYLYSLPFNFPSNSSPQPNT